MSDTKTIIEKTTEEKIEHTDKKVPLIIELGDSDLDDVVGAYRCAPNPPHER